MSAADLDERYPSGDVGKHNSVGTPQSSPPGSPSEVPKSPAEESDAKDQPSRPGKKPSSVRIKKQYSKIYRIKTKILQNLGKADKTTDEVFDEYETNFNKQQLHANRLHKEVSNYLRCARALHGATKALYECISEVYEPEWVGHDLVYVQAQNSDMLWSDFCHKIQDQALAPLTNYVQEFPEIRKKIDKRGRKLVDYDSQRHQLENLQRAARRDEYKIARARDTLETARSTYQALNKDLYETLPTVYDQRIPQTADCLQTLFAAEGTFMQESSKISQEVEAIAEKLNNAKGIYKAKRSDPPKEPKPLSDTPTLNAVTKRPESVSSQDSLKGTENASLPITPVPVNEEDPPKYTLYPNVSPNEVVASKEASQELYAVEDKDDKSSEKSDSFTQAEKKVEEEELQLGSDQEVSLESNNPFREKDNDPSSPATSPAPPVLPETPPSEATDAPVAPAKNSAGDQKPNRPTISSPVTQKDEGTRPYEEIDFEERMNGSRNVPANTNGDIGQVIPPGATTEGLPAGVLYKVKASYKYQREDVDEISFDVGEIIQVVEYEDPEEQEEGWLCGMKESTQEKGLFPANFTRPI